MRTRLSYCLFVLLGLVCVGMGAEEQHLAWAVSQEVKIEKVEVRFSPSGPVVFLKVGERAIPVFVDPTVAGSIQGALSGEKYLRPLSHDLMKSILSSYDIQVQQVFITLRDGVYFGTLTLFHNGRVQLFDSRSSDAIALAVHFQSPILVEQELLDSVGIEMSQGESNQEGLEL